MTSYWQTTTGAQPAKPTTATPPAAWTTTEPGYEAGKTLWRVEKVTYSNSTFAYSAVSKVSAYVAAGEALYVANLASETAAGLVSLASEPPQNPPIGQIWVPRNSDGNATGLWRWNGSAWETATNILGLLLVPTADGGQTLIGPDGVEASQVVADILRSKVLYADVAGIQTLVITDIPRENLASDVGDALSAAEDLADRIILESGTITIAKNRKDDGQPLTAMRLTATSLDFIAADKSVAYIDSTLEQMSIANVLVRDALVIGSHQVRTIPGTGVTVFQQVVGA